MYWHFFNMASTSSPNDNDISTKKLEVISSSLPASCLASFCFFTLFINVWVCCRIYRKRNLRSSCTALMVANVALVDILVSIKDFPFLLSVSVSSKWYFEPDWCRSYGLTNVVYIIVSVSTIVSVATDRYITGRENQVGGNKSNQDLGNTKILLLGYVIAQTTLSYSLSLLWSKYIFLSRKAFCLVEFSSTNFPLSMIVSFLFLIPIATLAFSLLNNISGKTQTEITNVLSNKDHQSANSEEADGEDSRIHSHLQAAIGMFLVSWCPYIIDSFFPSPESPSVPGMVSAFVPVMTNSLMPMYFMLTQKPRIANSNCKFAQKMSSTPASREYCQA